MSSFCQNVETGAEVSGGPKSTSGSPSSLSRSADSSSSSFGLAGFSSEYVFTPKRPGDHHHVERPVPLVAPAVPVLLYSRKLIAVAFLASVIVFISWTFFAAPRRLRSGRCRQHERRAERAEDHSLYLSRMPSRIRGLVGGGHYSPRSHATLRGPLLRAPGGEFRN